MKKKSPGSKPHKQSISTKKLIDITLANNDIVKIKCGHPKRPMPLMGELEIESYVLEDGTAVISGYGAQKAIGLGTKSGKELKIFLNKISDYITDDFRKYLDNQIRFDLSQIYGRAIPYGVGFKATFLPELCDVILSAREAGAFKTEKELKVAQRAEIITRALSRVGIIALIYEWTGYEKYKDSSAYRIFIDAYLSEQVRKWSKEFPDEFFVQLDRIYQNQPTTSRNRPLYYANFIRKYVYKPLEEGYVLKELDKKNPKNEKGARLKRHHSYLSEKIGLPAVKAQIWQVTGALKVSASKKKFEDNFARLTGQSIQTNIYDDIDSEIK